MPPRLRAGSSAAVGRARAAASLGRALDSRPRAGYSVEASAPRPPRKLGRDRGSRFRYTYDTTMTAYENLQAAVLTVTVALGSRTERAPVVDEPAAAEEVSAV